MPILSNDYKPPFLFKYRHINTIYSSLFRKTKPVFFKRKRIETLDDDFLDIDFIEFQIYEKNQNERSAMNKDQKVF